MTHPELQELLRRYRLQEATPEERQVVEQWYEALHYPERQLTNQEWAAFEAALWARIASKTIELAEPLPTLNTEQNSWFRWVAAAVLIVSGGVGLFWQQLHPAEVAHHVSQTPPVTTTADTTWLQIPNNTPTSITLDLADGSTVTLTPTSSLRYPRRFQGAKRKVYLQGEGFFKVAHNPTQPFQVYTDKVVTTVLGTSFTVRAFANQEALVKVRTGRVRVNTRIARKSPNQTAGIVLLPNQQTIYTLDKPELKKELVADPVQLTEESFVFNDRPVTEVLAALEKAYGVSILYDNASLANCTVSIILREKSLFDKLDILCKTLGASYQVKGTQVNFSAKGCPKE